MSRRPAPASVAHVAKRTAPPRLKAELQRCTQHRDCSLMSELLDVTSCAPVSPMVALRADAAAEIHAAWIATCGPRPNPCACGGDLPPTCCPPVMAPDQSSLPHAACVDGLCAVRPEPHYTRDEQREDAAGIGTLDDTGACYRDVDCAASFHLTAFPLGATDAQGRALCPVCPRPGTPLPDEDARTAALAAACPRRACAVTGTICTRRSCAMEPPRAARAPVVATPDPPEPEAPPVLPLLPEAATHQCKSTADCTVVPDCCGVLLVERRRDRSAEDMRCAGHPCADRHPEERERPVATCFAKRCVSTVLADDYRKARAETAA